MDKLPDLTKLTSEQKDILILILFEENQKLRELVHQLEMKVKVLEEKVNRNSSNSHKPPSSDVFRKSAVKKPKSDRKSGGQIGHKGWTLTASQTPDGIKEHKLKDCPCCGQSVEQVKGRITKTQVFDIPDLSVKVTEHHIHEIKCPYCHAICRPFVPKEISAPVQYGPRFRSLLLYLHNYHFVSAQRMQEFCQDVFGHTLSQSSLFEAEKLAAKNLQSFERILKEKLKTSFVLHADETALRVNKQLFWLHVASTKEATLFFAHPKRSYQAIVEMDVLPSFRGVLIHDHYAPYFKFNCQHALCHAHHLRELEGVFETTKLKWAKEMKELLQEIDLFRNC